MTKDQLIRRISDSTKAYVDAMEDIAKHVTKMQNYDNAMIVKAITVPGNGIVDALNSIALILCEMLPKEE